MASTDALTQRGHSAAWYLPLTTSAGDISAKGTEIKFLAITKPRPVYAKSADGGGGGGGDVVSAQLADGVTIEVDKVTRVIDGTTGLHKNKSAGGGGDVDKITFDSLLAGRTKVAEAAAMRGQVGLVCVMGGDSIAASEEAFYFLIATMTSEVPVDGSPEAIGVIPFEFSGGKSYTNSLGATLQHAFGALTPISNTTEFPTAAITPPALDADDVTALLKGEILQKAAA